MISPLGLNIEREYLYWTNYNITGAHGAIHKAFTEPFMHSSPFMTYDVYHTTKCYDIVSNENFIFFTGQRYYDSYEMESS